MKYKGKIGPSTFFICITTIFFTLFYSSSINNSINTNNDALLEPYQYSIAEDITLLKLSSYFSREEINIIMKAAIRNNLTTEQIAILFAIRKSENGEKRRELGIIHPICEQQMNERPYDTLDIQAGWCAATIKKNYQRWIDIGKPGDYITFLGSKYCPTTGNLNKKEIELNSNWIPNVKYWTNKIKE